MANVTLHNYCTPNPWFNTRALFMAGAEAGGESAPKNAVDQYREQVVNKVSDLELRADLNKMIDTMQGHSVPPQKMMALVGGVIEAMKGEGLATEKKDTLKKAWKEATKDGIVNESEVKDLIEIGTRLKLQSLMEDLKHPYTYLKRDDGSRVLDPKDIKVDDNFTLHFGLKEEGINQNIAKEALQRHLSVILPTDVMEVNIVSNNVANPPEGHFTLVRSQPGDGEFRIKGQPKSARFQVLQGDQITIVRKNAADGVLITKEPPIAIPVVKDPSRAVTRESTSKEDATERETAIQKGYAQEQSEFLNKALGKMAGSIANLERGSSVRFPTQLKSARIDAYQNRLLRMDQGEQVLSSLQTLDGMGQKEGWDQLLKKLMDGKVVRFQEITRSVLNQGPKELRGQYDRVANDVKVIDFASPLIDSEINKMTRGELTEFQLIDGKLPPDKQALFLAHLITVVKTAMLADASFKETDVSRFYQYFNELIPVNVVDESQLPRKQNLEALRNELSRLSTFYTESYKLMEAIPQLSDTQAGTVEYRDEEKDQSVVQTEQLIAKLFDPNNQGSIRFGDTLTKVNAKSVDDTQKYISDAAAYQIMRDGASHFEDGKELVNPEDFAKHLEQLRHDGWNLSYPETDYDLSPITKETIQKWTADGAGPSVQDRTLIRAGMVWEQRSEHMSQNNLLENEALKKDAVLNAYPEAVREALTKLDNSGSFDAEDLKTMGEAIKEADLGMLGFLVEQERSIDHNAPEAQAETIEKRLGVGYNKAFTVLDNGKQKVSLALGARNNIITHDFSIQAGANVEQKLGERVRVEGGVGGSVGKGGIGKGVELAISMDLDKYKTTSLTASAGLGWAKVYASAMLGISVNRDLDAVVGKKAEQLWETREASIDRGMRDLIQSHADSFQYLSPKQQEEFITQIKAQYKNDIESDAIDAMNRIQFKGAGVVLIENPIGPGLIPIPWIRIGVKGKEFLQYAVPEDQKNLKQIAEIKLKQAQDTRTDSSSISAVAISGTLEMTQTAEGVEKTITEGHRFALDLNQARLSSLNAQLINEGMEVKSIDGHLQIRVKKVDGLVNLYTDGQSGIETAVDNGYVTINLGPDQILNLQRVDTYYPAPYFGYTHHTSLYLSDQAISPSAIEKSTKDHMQWTQSDRLKTQSAAQRKENSTAERTQTSFQSVEALGDKKQDFLLSAQETSDRKAAYEHMRRSLNQKDSNESLDPARKTALKELAKKVIALKQVDYIKLTSDEIYYGNIQNEIQKQAAKPLSNLELTYVIQEILVGSRPKTKLEKMARHIETWNRIALENALKRTLPPEKANLAPVIAQKIMRHYHDTLIQDLEAGKSLVPTPIRDGIVHTYIGPKATGNYMEFVKGEQNAVVNLLGAQAITMEKLTNPRTFGLTPEEATAFIEAKKTEMAPMDPAQPNQLLHSPIGLALLDLSDLIFDAKTTEALATLVEKNPKTAGEIPTELKSAYDALTQLALQLREKGSVELSNHLILKNTQELTMGFLESCRNYTSSLNENIAIDLNQLSEAKAVNVRAYMESHPGAIFYGAGVAGGKAYSRSDTKKTASGGVGSDTSNVQSNSAGGNPHNEDAPSSIYE